MIETTPVRTFSASKRFKRTWSIEQRDQVLQILTEFKDFVQPEPAQNERQIVIDNELDVNLNDSIENELNAFFTDFKNLQ